MTVERQFHIGANNICAVLDQLRADGFEVNDKNVARLSPPLHAHINILVRFQFLVPDAVAKSELRPLCNPASDE